MLIRKYEQYMCTDVHCIDCQFIMSSKAIAALYAAVSTTITWHPCISEQQSQHALTWTRPLHLQKCNAWRDYRFHWRKAILPKCFRTWDRKHISRLSRPWIHYIKRLPKGVKCKEVKEAEIDLCWNFHDVLVGERSSGNLGEWCLTSGSMVFDGTPSLSSTVGPSVLCLW